MSRKIFDKSLNPKKILVSSKNIIEWEKVPCIPPIYYSNKFISEIKAKCEYFNLYFAGQCTPHVNNSQLPTKFATDSDSVLTSLISLLNKLVILLRN